MKLNIYLQRSGRED